jgi:hypothetical protein
MQECELQLQVCAAVTSRLVAVVQSNGPAPSLSAPLLTQNGDSPLPPFPRQEAERRAAAAEAAVVQEKAYRSQWLATQALEAADREYERRVNASGDGASTPSVRSDPGCAWLPYTVVSGGSAGEGRGGTGHPPAVRVACGRAPSSRRMLWRTRRRWAAASSPARPGAARRTPSRSYTPPRSPSPEAAAPGVRGGVEGRCGFMPRDKIREIEQLRFTFGLWQ